jgi:hypothetical protein
MILSTVWPDICSYGLKNIVLFSDSWCKELVLYSKRCSDVIFSGIRSFLPKCYEREFDPLTRSVQGHEGPEVNGYSSKMWSGKVYRNLLGFYNFHWGYYIMKLLVLICSPYEVFALLKIPVFFWLDTFLITFYLVPFCNAGTISVSYLILFLLVYLIYFCFFNLFIFNFFSLSILRSFLF